MRQFLLILFFLLSNLVFSQTHEVDSLYKALKANPKEDTTRLRIIFNLCYREYTSHPEKNKTLAEEALRISKNINTPQGVKATGTANRYIAMYYWTIGEYAMATKYAYEMLRIFEKTQYDGGMGQAYQLLGAINEDGRGGFEKTRAFYGKALQFYQKSKRKRDIGYCFNSLGVLHYNASKYDTAAYYFLKSLMVRKEINDEDGISQTYGNLAHVYMGQKKYALSLEYFEKAIPLIQKLNNSYRLVGDYSGLGELYSNMGEYAKAEFYLLKSVDLAQRINQKKMLEEIYGKLVLLEKSRRKFENALTYATLQSAYRDSIYTENRTKQIADMETRYETEKKDQAILLLERDKKIQQIWTTVLITGIILLVILSVVIYVLQRYRETKNRQILNLEIDNLTNQHKELSEKYKNILTSGSEKSIESQDQRLLKKAIEVVESNISDPLFGVEQMAKEMGMSRTNMHRKIKSITGFPPSELMRSIRLRKAALLLLNQADSVAQISFKVGFEDHSYFSKSFKKQFGVSPSEYNQSVSQRIN